MFRILLNITKKPKTLIITSNGSNNGYVQNNNNKKQQNLFNLNLFGNETNDGVQQQHSINNFNKNETDRQTRFNYLTRSLSSSSSGSSIGGNGSSSSSSTTTTTTTTTSSPSKKKQQLNTVNLKQTTTTTNTLSQQPLQIDIKLLIKQIEMDPKNIENYQRLSDVLGEKGRVVINGKEIGQKEILLEILQLDSNQPIIHYYLYVWLKTTGDISTPITFKNSVDGTIKTYSLQDLLIKEIELNPLFTQSYIEISTYLSTIQDDRISIPMVMSNGQIKSIPLTKLEIYLKVLDIEPDNSIALHHLSTFLIINKYSNIQMLNGETLTTKEIAFRNYIINKHSTPFASIYLSDLLNPMESVTLPVESSTTTTTTDAHSSLECQINSIKILKDAIQLFPYEHRLLLKLSERLTNNLDMVELMIPTENGELKSQYFTRLNLICIAITSQESYCQENNLELPLGLSDYYIQLSDYLDNKTDIIQDTFGKQHTKQSLYIEALKINSNNFRAKQNLINILSTPELKFELLLPLVQQQQSSSVDYKFVYSTLSKLYKQQGNQIESDKFKKLLELEVNGRKKQLIKMIDDYPFNCDYFNALYFEMDDNEVLLLQTVEFSVVEKKQFKKLDVLLRAIQLNPKKPFLHYELYKQLQQQDQINNVSIKLLDGVTTLDKYSALSIEIQNNPNFAQSWYQLSKLPNLDNNIIQDNYLSKKIQLLSITMSLDPKFSEAYFDCAMLMVENSIESSCLHQAPNTVFSDTDPSFTRKDLFIKSILQADPVDPLNGCKNVLAWYQLSLEMEDHQEIQFEMNKKQILQMILNKLDSNFIPAYKELVKLLSNETETVLISNIGELNKFQILNIINNNANNENNATNTQQYI